VGDGEAKEMIENHRWSARAALEGGRERRKPPGTARPRGTGEDAKVEVANGNQRRPD